LSEDKIVFENETHDLRSFCSLLEKLIKTRWHV